MSGVLILAGGNEVGCHIAGALARFLLPPTVPVYSATSDDQAGLALAEMNPYLTTVMAEFGIDITPQVLTPIAEIPVARIGHVVRLGGGDAAAPPLPPAIAQHVQRAQRLLWWVGAPAGESSGGLHALRAMRDEILGQVQKLAASYPSEPTVGVIGGSGFYDFPGLENAERFDVDTPFGRASAPILVGRYHGRRVAFLARHGEGHRLLPSEVNARANIYALKRIGVTKIISISAVGSLREEIGPGDVVLPRQFLDRTVGRPTTFFGNGVVAHVSLADPICNSLADTLRDSAQQLEAKVHPSGTYICIEGPQFSTRAESSLWRSWGADVIGMTNLPEARLAREAEICYATVALPTDYDCWRTRTEEVRVSDVISVLLANVDKARRLLATALDHIDPAGGCSCQRVLDSSLLTDPATLDKRGRLRMHALIARRLSAGHG